MISSINIDLTQCMGLYLIITLSLLLQYDAFDIGFITTDDFTNADILEATYPAVSKRLHGDWINEPSIPIVTGFLGKVLFLILYSNS